MVLPLRNDADKTVPNYGLQPPALPAASLTLVDDLDDPNLGPAYHFQGTFNKLVILEESSGFMKGTKRSPGDRAPPPDQAHGNVVQPGERPWYCYWNGTMIEGYLYRSPTGNQVIEPLTSMKITTISTTVPIDVLSSPTAQPELPKAPFIAKIEERRLPENDSPPACQQMQLTVGGSMVPVTDANGNTIVVKVEEKDPTFEEYHYWSPRNERMMKDKRADPLNSCHCQWMWS